MTDPPAPNTGIPATDGTGSAPKPPLLCDTRALAALAAAPAGELWRLSGPGRELDAGIVRLLPGQRAETRAEADPEVLVLVLAGDATATTPHGPRHLTGGSLLWLPRGSTAALTAGESGLTCLKVHRRRPGPAAPGTVVSAPRPLPGRSAAAPDGAARPDWPRWLC